MDRTLERVTRVVVADLLSNHHSMSLELRHLHLLVALERYGSLHSAARHLHLTASALSLQLRALEQHLGGTLFERRWRKLHVTPAGRQLTQTAHEVLSTMARAESDTRDVLSGRAGVLRVTTACMQSYRWLPAVIGAWSARHPGATVAIVADEGSAPLDALRAGTIDVALVVGTADADRALRLAPLFRDELVAVVGTSHRLAKARRIRVRELASEHYWGSADSFDEGTPLGASFRAERVSWRQVTELPFASGAPLEMARAGLGVTVCPRWFVSPEVARGEIVPLRIGKGLWLRWHAASRAAGASPLVPTFVAEMKRHTPTA